MSILKDKIYKFFLSCIFINTTFLLIFSFFYSEFYDSPQSLNILIIVFLIIFLILGFLYFRVSFEIFYIATQGMNSALRILIMPIILLFPLTILIFYFICLKKCNLVSDLGLYRQKLCYFMISLFLIYPIYLAVLVLPQTLGSMGYKIFSKEPYRINIVDQKDSVLNYPLFLLLPPSASGIFQAAISATNVNALHLRQKDCKSKNCFFDLALKLPRIFKTDASFNGLLSAVVSMNDFLFFKNNKIPNTEALKQFLENQEQIYADYRNNLSLNTLIFPTAIFSFTGGIEVVSMAYINAQIFHTGNNALKALRSKVK